MPSWAGAASTTANIFVHSLLFLFFVCPLLPADLKNRNSPRSNLKFRFDKLSHSSSSMVGARALPVGCAALSSLPARGGLGSGGDPGAREGQKGRDFVPSCPFVCNPPHVLFFHIEPLAAGSNELVTGECWSVLLCAQRLFGGQLCSASHGCSHLLEPVGSILYLRAP